MGRSARQSTSALSLAEKILASWRSLPHLYAQSASAEISSVPSRQTPDRGRESQYQPLASLRHNVDSQQTNLYITTRATIYILERCRATIIFVVLLFIRAVRIPVSLLNLIPDCALHFGLDIFCAAPSTRSKSLVSPCFIAFERRPG